MRPSITASFTQIVSQAIRFIDKLGGRLVHTIKDGLKDMFTNHAKDIKRTSRPDSVDEFNNHFSKTLHRNDHAQYSPDTMEKVQSLKKSLQEMRKSTIAPSDIEDNDDSSQVRPG